ncbi:hypothetical protein [Lysobacter sp. CFH 32150]|uniref:hypothetical protein n=1 Tax=Lysobacter sp. CFH 32150 TaxID=2927128 RepID=UPI001FA6FE8D|nr:hypothetical protein [Lysobacter sp. CFH 32150]MCI4567893.1 hypothetical protein [Lysobacter sp. CFH 32150]
MFRHLRIATALLLCLLAACQRQPQGGETRPAQAVQALADRLRDNDLTGFAAMAVPPALHAQLEAGWRDGRSRWPLDELPLDERLPGLLAVLSAKDAETKLQATFDREFARAGRDLQAAAAALGLFGMQYVRNEGDYSAEERAHYLQSIDALSRWASAAPLSDPQRARRTIALLTAAARRSGIDDDADFAALGMADSLDRLQPVFAAFKRTFAGYGLDLDASFASVDARLLQQTGDSARVRLHYRLGPGEIDSVVSMQRIDGRWYLRDYLRHAEASLVPAAAASAISAAP